MSTADGTGQPVRRRQRTMGRSGVTSVQRTNYHSGSPVSESVEDGELLDVPVFQTEPAHVEVVGSITRNMGNYNSVRIEVKLCMPSLPEMSEVDRVYSMASSWVEDKLNQELAQANETRSPSESERRR